MQRCVLLTGGTGFVGSALAASMLARGHKVVALSRNDPGGARTRDAVADAISGLSIEPATGWHSRLSIANVDLSQPEMALEKLSLDEVTDTWHVAAEMSYQPAKLPQAFHFNVASTSKLYSAIARRARNCKRFYYVSTAYTAGLDQDEVPERLHDAPRLLNPYQVTKWSAEAVLARKSADTGLPVTIFRPSVVIGDSVTGWNGTSSFGFYMFLDGLRLAAAHGAKAVTLDLRPDAQPNIVPIDVVVKRAVALTETTTEREQLEVFHCVADSTIENRLVLDQMSNATGVQVFTGPPRTPIDELFNKHVSLNKPFADGDWRFCTKRLKQVLGKAYSPSVVSETLVATVSGSYCGARNEDVASKYQRAAKAL
ncbi:MAG: SDR family oxidoreductase [Deltaproteobacteria bacterium]|nr:SDR family oxidoreductase [Deltaproteobacteria bacterium]